jgi:polar amino acid transport system permease protein
MAADSNVDINALQDWMLSSGFNLTLLWDPIDRNRFLLGLGLTISLAVLSLAVSLVIGVLGAIAKGSGIAPLRQAVTLYIEVFRNTPMMIQLFFFYFGLGSLLPVSYNEAGDAVRSISNFQWAVLVLGIHAGAYKIEAIRGSFDAVPRSTIEAAESLGLNRAQVLRKIVLPLALRNCLPVLGNSMAQAVKSTSIAFAIAVPELTYAANRIWSENLNVPEMMVVLFLTYFVLLGTVSFLMRRLEDGLRLPGVHA